MRHAFFQMMLPLCNHHLSLPPKTLPNPSPPFPFFSFLPSQYPKNHPRFLLLPRASADTQTLPQSAIQRIADKLRSLGYVDDTHKEDLNTNPNYTSPGEVFVPLPKHLPKHRVGHTLDPSWSTPENPVPEPGSGNAITRFHELRRGVLEEKEKERVKRRGEKRGSVPTLAELTLPKEELRRLRTIGIGLKKKLKVGKAGITEGIVNGIHERWRRVELVKINCEDLCRINMMRTHDLLERKTGGVVIWRSGSNIILYRGADYKYPYFLSDTNSTNDISDGALPDLRVDCGLQAIRESSSSGTDGVKSAAPNSSHQMSQLPRIQGVGSPNRVRFQLPGEAELAEEADRLLDGLGPRFTDWWGYDPLPVDADLLPAIVPGYRRPFRLLPYGVKPKLTNDEMTTLKRLGRPLSCHFALGRNRNLQGLAASILKLWEKCEIAKIAIKRGVQNTNSELMAEELKRLTGGTLLSKDKEFIVLYRGKDFLPAAVSSVIQDRRKYGVQGEQNKHDCSSSAKNAQEHKLEIVGSACEDGCDRANYQEREVVSEQRKLRSTEAAVKRTSTKLSVALAKKSRAEKLLAELENEEIIQQPEIDKEGITEEERYMLRKVGLRMNPFLLLGRRGVFDGTVENMHLHWKYRELVKILCGERRSVEDIHGIARTLEAESGGILVAVERVSKGYAIIVYRGKNYKRPDCLRPQTLLNKKKAMKRFIEAQRSESLKLHVLKLCRNIDDLKLQLAKDKEADNLQSAKDSEVQLVKEQEMNKMHPPHYKGSDTDVETYYHSSLVTPACDKENVGARERYGVDSTSFNLNDGMDASRDGLQTSQLDMLRDFSLKYEDKDEHQFDISKQDSLPELTLKEAKFVTDMNGECRDAESMTYSSFRSQGQKSFSAISNAETRICDVKTVESSVNLPKSESGISVHRVVEYGSDQIPLRDARLSNKERLLLRKQALQMKKRPVLAVGKSNIVTGVAKTIKTHFKKHPLAIVNVKGRAKGTSVQDVVSKLEEATGGVLVSQEPSKVILYRGWGAGEKPGQTNEKITRDLRSTSAGREGGALPIVSPELMSAIRLECGLQ